MSTHEDVFGARTSLEGVAGAITYYRLGVLRERGADLDHLPFTVKVILENALRHAGSDLVSEKDVMALANWTPGSAARSEAEYAYMPGRVLLQDFTGVPSVADLAAMRKLKAAFNPDHFFNPCKIFPLHHATCAEVPRKPSSALAEAAW